MFRRNKKEKFENQINQSNRITDLGTFWLFSLIFDNQLEKKVDSRLNRSFRSGSNNTGNNSTLAM
mgnify:CR=1 FL=1